jgi:ATP-dependent RNA helicase DeaD
MSTSSFNVEADLQPTSPVLRPQTTESVSELNAENDSEATSAAVSAESSADVAAKKAAAKPKPAGLSFADLDLPPALKKSLERLKFTQPTPIQEKAIPLIFKKTDIIGSAQTGTGKTMAFALPVVAELMSNTMQSALILAPTRELALQISDVFRSLTIGINNFKMALLIGGANMYPQTLRVV